MDIRAYWDEAIAAHTVALQASRDLDDPARTRGPPWNSAR